MSELRGRRYNLGIGVRDMAAGLGIRLGRLLSIEAGTGTEEDKTFYRTWLSRIEGWSPSARRIEMQRGSGGGRFGSGRGGYFTRRRPASVRLTECRPPGNDEPTPVNRVGDAGRIGRDRVHAGPLCRQSEQATGAYSSAVGEISGVLDADDQSNILTFWRNGLANRTVGEIDERPHFCRRLAARRIKSVTGVFRAEQKSRSLPPSGSRSEQ